MAREIPEVVRAVAGLAATVIDEARKLPETLPGLPVRLAGLAMQTAMKVQQSYTGLVARGDEVFTGIRGEDEPGLATFDDEVEAQTGGYRESKFDRADVTFADNEVAGVPDGEADATVAAVGRLSDQISTARETVQDTAASAPSTDDVLDELALDEQLPAAPKTTPPAKAAPAKRGTRKQAAKKSAPAKKQTAKKAPPAKKSTRSRAASPDAEADVVTPAEAAVDEAAGSQPATDESGGTVAAATGVATDVGANDTGAEDAAIAEGAAVDTVGGESAAPTDDAQGGSELSGSQAAGTAPVEGYDGWSIAQLRGRLRGYAESTVRELLDYEQATRAREPYVRMLRNRLERVQANA